jgi:hypothetical protein
MGLLFASVTLVAAGTPQQLSLNTSPAMPTSEANGITRSIPQTAFQVTIQAPPTNTGNIFIGGAAMSKTTLANVGQVLAPGASFTLGYGNKGVLLDSIWADTATSGNLALITLVG